MLLEGGFQAFAVGGCVRNELLGVEVADVDIATDAHPETVVSLAQAAGLAAVPTGIEHGTVTVVASGIGHEVTTFRKDIETDGRRAVVEYAKSLEEDAHRRDFTMNALYAAFDGELVDPLNAMPDIAAGRVRFIDDPSDRIREDYLRILRFFRFHAWFGDPEGGIDPDALAACAELAEGLETLSKERVGGEVKKLLNAPDPAPSVAAMGQTGVLMRILPGAQPAALPILVHLEEQAGLGPNWLSRLACLGGENHKAFLRMSRSDDRQLALYRHEAMGLGHVAELAYRHGADEAVTILLIRAALTGQDIPDNLQQQAQTAAAQEFPINARDLMPDFQGPDLGARLKELETAWIESGFKLTRDQLLA